MQKAVVAWDASVWSCDMQEGSYPVLVGSANMPDAIEDVNVNVNTRDVYDLTGRKVNSQLKKGIYIVGGKKVLFR
jgi:hypothetical protein